MILQSGSSLTVWSFDDFPERNARDIAKIAGFNPKASVEELNDFFMNVDLQTLYKAHNKHMVNLNYDNNEPLVWIKRFLFQFNGFAKGGNTVGGHRLTIGGPSGVMPITPFNNMKRLKGRKNLPMMIGNCKHDSTYSFLGKYYMIVIRTFTYLPNRWNVDRKRKMN
jgi:acetylcholinesterase